MTQNGPVLGVVEVGPDEDMRFITPPGATDNESATFAEPTPIAAIEKPEPAKLPTKIRVRKPLPSGQEAFDDLLTFLDRLPVELPLKTKTFSVFGHRVAWNHRRDIARLAGIALLEQMSSWEFARVVQQGGYGLESYMQTLKAIRDNVTVEPKDRMTAADKLLQLFSVFMGSATQENLPRPTPETTGNLMQILVNVRGEEGEADEANRLPEATGLPALGDSNASS